MKILLIAGHGQGDPGACACGYQEATLTREIVSLLKNKLSSFADVSVFDTSKNMYKYLKSGSSYNFQAFDYVFEIHFNAGVGDISGNGKTTGVEILVHTSERGVSVEQGILNNITALGFKNRGVKTRSNLLVMNTCKGKQGVSYALLETCFIDDLDDMKRYQAKKNEIADSITKGIIDGFGLNKIETKTETEKALLTSPNDITWELNAKYFPIHETDNFVKALTEAKKQSSPLYWGYYKLVNGIK